MTEPHSSQMLLAFLQRVDTDFPVPLSQKQALPQYAQKLHASATVCAACRDGKIIAMAAGYTENTIDDLGYIALVATLEEARGQGHASRLVMEFLDIARTKGLRGVHLYAVASNEPAVRMYRKLGFTDYHPQNEPRPDDLHLIYYFMR